MFRVWVLRGAEGAKSLQFRLDGYARLTKLTLPKRLLIVSFVGHQDADSWRSGRVVEGTGFENQRAFIAHRGFESHLLLSHKTAMVLWVDKVGDIVNLAGAASARNMSAVARQRSSKLVWRSGRVAEGAPLLREYTFIAYRGFESLLLFSEIMGLKRRVILFEK